ncbi:hypothetical protein [Lactobacillus sp. wkB10]|uniref:hypothetical protein n=1 Tax=Lactobacillus sp. wkB10 TaxID=1545701 RepID=UPI0005146023|nr:hypothetical protein [Lactobacillus sp. wkB10]KGG54587.1 hypothetical protein LACWKB10_0543 [Lactobacillus sp. wkB10]
MDQTSKIELDLSSGSFSISGTEAFINNHLEGIENFISKNKHVSDSEKQNYDNHNFTKKDKYESTIYKLNQKNKSIEILKPIPGKNKSERMKNVTLITLYAKEHTENIRSAERREIAKLCLKGGCLDSHNMKNVLKKYKKLFILKEDKSSWSVELTTDGEIAAKKLLKEMYQND